MEPTHARQETADAAATPPGDDLLLLAVQARDDAALAELYDRYGRLAFGLAYRILGERGVAEDVVQEAFLNVWRRAGSFQTGRGGVRPWLLSIVHNLAIDRRRGRYRRELQDVPLESVTFALENTGDDPFVTVAGELDAARIHAALATLPLDQRQAIELAYFAGLTHQEIAERTETPLGTVKSRLRLGLHKLRAVLGDTVLDSGIA
ncbi:MAG: sigma-70 family RNA polymerase sigma factor [Thermomicrobiales bacterium]